MALSLGVLLGVIGNITAILVLVSPMPTMRLIFKKRAIENFSPQPYLCTLMSSLLWTYYGSLKSKDGILLMSINAIACLFQLFYLSFFLRFGNKNQRIKTTSFLCLVLSSFAMGVFLVRAITQHHDNAQHHQQLTILGFLCSITSAATNAAPLTVICLVVRTKSVEYMPFTLSLCLFLNGATWLAYGIAIRDFYVIVTNGIGLTLTLLQLVIYMYIKMLARWSKSSKLDQFGKQVDNKIKEIEVEIPHDLNLTTQHDEKMKVEKNHLHDKNNIENAPKMEVIEVNFDNANNKNDIMFLNEQNGEIDHNQHALKQFQSNTKHKEVEYSEQSVLGIHDLEFGNIKPNGI